MTPYEINLLLHIYAIREDHPDETRRPPVYEPTMQAFIGEGLVEPCPVQAPPGSPQPTWALTKRGRAYVELGLMRVPLPVNDWRIPVPNEWAATLDGDTRT